MTDLRPQRRGRKIAMTDDEVNRVRGWCHGKTVRFAVVHQREFRSAVGLTIQPYDEIVVILNVVTSAEYARWRESFEKGLDFFRAQMRTFIAAVQQSENLGRSVGSAASRLNT